MFDVTCEWFKKRYGSRTQDVEEYARKNFQTIKEVLGSNSKHRGRLRRPPMTPSSPKP